MCATEPWYGDRDTFSTIVADLNRPRPFTAEPAAASRGTAARRRQSHACRAAVNASSQSSSTRIVRGRWIAFDWAGPVGRPHEGVLARTSRTHAGQGSGSRDARRRLENPCDRTSRSAVPIPCQFWRSSSTNWTKRDRFGDHEDGLILIAADKCQDLAVVRMKEFPGCRGRTPGNGDGSAITRFIHQSMEWGLFCWEFDVQHLVVVFGIHDCRKVESLGIGLGKARVAVRAPLHGGAHAIAVAEVDVCPPMPISSP